MRKVEGDGAVGLRKIVQEKNNEKNKKRRERQMMSWSSRPFDGKRNYDHPIWAD